MCAAILTYVIFRISHGYHLLSLLLLPRKEENLGHVNATECYVKFFIFYKKFRFRLFNFMSTLNAMAAYFLFLFLLVPLNAISSQMVQRLYAPMLHCYGMLRSAIHFISAPCNMVHIMAPDSMYTLISDTMFISRHIPYAISTWSPWCAYMPEESTAKTSNPFSFFPLPHFEFHALFHTRNTHLLVHNNR